MALMRNIVIVDYDTEWPEQFASEARLVTNGLDLDLIELHHIGSTSVPGLAAKPVIDMLAVVTSLSNLDAFNDAMIAIGYQPKGELGIAGRRFFSKGRDDCRTHHIHAFEAGHVELKRHLDFRDYLRVHPAQANRYAELKRKLAEDHRNDIEAYVEGKSPRIDEILEKAEQWALLASDR